MPQAVLQRPQKARVLPGRQPSRMIPSSRANQIKAQLKTLSKEQIDAIVSGAFKKRLGFFRPREPGRRLLALGLNKKRLDERNHGLSRLLELGCDARDLRALGYNATELCHSGIKALDLIKAGFDIPTVLRESSWSTTTDLEMWSTGNYFEDLKGVLKACGFGPLQIRRAMLEEQKRVAREKSENLKRFPEHRKEIRELFRPGFAGRLFNLLDYTAADAKRVHLPAEELFYGNFSAEELAKGGYSLQEIKAAHYDARAMSPLVNYNAKKLRELGFDAYQLKLARYSAFALARSGFSRPELLHAGFSQKAVDKAFAQLQKAGLAARLRERPEQPRELQPAKAAA